MICILDSAVPIRGFVDDYAFLIQGLLDLYEACYDTRWLAWCEQLQDKQDQLFWDAEAGGYFMSDDQDPSIVLRMKDGMKQKWGHSKIQSPVC